PYRSPGSAPSTSRQGGASARLRVAPAHLASTAQRFARDAKVLGRAVATDVEHDVRTCGATEARPRVRHPGDVDAVYLLEDVPSLEPGALRFAALGDVHDHDRGTASPIALPERHRDASPIVVRVLRGLFGEPHQDVPVLTSRLHPRQPHAAPTNSRRVSA